MGPSLLVDGGEGGKSNRGQLAHLRIWAGRDVLLDSACRKNSPCSRTGPKKRLKMSDGGFC